MKFTYGIPVITEEQHKEVARWAGIHFRLDKKCIFCNVAPSEINDQWVTDYGMLIRHEPATGQLSNSHMPIVFVVCPKCRFIYSFPLYESGALTPPDSEEQAH